MATDDELHAAWYVWRPVKPRRTKKGDSGSGFTAALLARPFRPTTKQTSAQLTRLEKRTPQVMVKVTKPTFGAAHTYQSMTYMSRNGREEMIDQDGEKYDDVREMGDLAERWTRDNREARPEGDRRVNQPDARRIQFSMPPGTDPDALRNAVAATARHVFDGKYEYVYSLHTDQPHPHVHLAVRTMSEDGQSLRINKDDLIYLRRTLALELRLRGVEADATPQIARGRQQRHDRTGTYRIKKQKGEAQFESNQPIDERISEAYRKTADQLAVSRTDDDKALARRITRYADSVFVKRPDAGLSSNLSGQSIAPLRQNQSAETLNTDQPVHSTSGSYPNL